MGKFIYVTTTDARDKLLAYGYNILKSDKEKNIYVFENRPELCFSLNPYEFVFSNTLTF